MKIEIKTGGAAFSDDGETLSYEGREEVRKILKYIGTEVVDGVEKGTVNDINGNKCCTWEI